MKTSSLLSPLALLAIRQVGPASAKENKTPMLTLNDDDSFNFDILTGLGQAHNDGADINPVLEAAKNIIPGDWDSYTKVWFDLANKTNAQALGLDATYGPVNVRASWFSAANYFRRADVYNRADWDDPRINQYWDEQRAAFDKAIASLPVPAERVELPAGEFNVSGIWYSQPSRGNTSEHHPTLILTQGFDAAQEDLYSTIVAPALTRGYNVFSFEGPGQPTVRREQGAGFIPEWERTVTPVVDYLLSKKAALVDAKKVVLFGNSFGGYLAARAAAFEPRLAALMLDGGIWDAYDGYSAFLSSDLIKLLESGDKEAFDKAANELQNDPDVSTTVRWGLLQGLWAFNTKSPYEFLQSTKAYTLKNGIADRIKIPTWIADGEFDDLMPGQSQRVKDALGDRAELHMFNGTAGFHCQTGAPQELNRVMFAWLNKTLNKS
ncbi:alpha beta hydrolase superfamily hydrolase [Fusarium heterosporum]|uniref:Alpha beta hydrolase superfamily hydrolase n=1 Tax=Fusarium heterosporum TaxID=42747 RepID=A0A8H5WR77_FUSHE|nr:alpha beta hydrolase superfamily hydrolase [Fusarium heterosporum]